MTATRRARRRGYRKDYADLFSQPDALFEGVNTSLWPNGESAILIRSRDGRRGIKITAKDGPAGLAVYVEQIPGLSPGLLDVFVDVGAEHVSTRLGDATAVTLGSLNNGTAMLDSVREVQVLQYRQDEKSQAFRKWIRAEGALPEGY